jgi:endonuclease YncB( thermonuclease family)
VGFGSVLVFVASIAVCQWPMIGPVGDDWSKFNHRSFITVKISDGLIVLNNAGPVRPIGIYVPTGNEAGAAGATGWLARQVVGRPVDLMLVGPQTRDPDGALRARVYLDGSDDLALSAVKAGVVYVDRRERDPFRPALAAAESDARKHGRGLWAGLRFDQMPPWRQAWLRGLAAKSKH